MRSCLAKTLVTIPALALEVSPGGEGAAGGMMAGVTHFREISPAAPVTFPAYGP